MLTGGRSSKTNAILPRIVRQSGTDKLGAGRHQIVQAYQLVARAARFDAVGPADDNQPVSQALRREPMFILQDIPQNQRPSRKMAEKLFSQRQLLL